MKCPKCQQNIPDHSSVCPICQAKLDIRKDGGAYSMQDTGRFSTVDPSKDSYDFDLQYTLTFKDAGEIRQSIADMKLGQDRKAGEDLFPADEKKEAEYRERPQRSLEEMEEAARRAALRRERRANGGKMPSFGRQNRGERVSLRDREKAAALRAAKARRVPSAQQVKKNRRLVFGTGVAVLVIALIIGTINLFAGMMDGDVKYPTIYTKENQLYIQYQKKPQQISSNLINAYAAPAATTTKTSSQKFVDPKVYKKTTATEKQLIHVSENGLYTFFMENMDLNTGRGDLIYYKNDSPKSRTLVSISVFYQFEIGKDGQSILFLRKTDDNGDHGELCYWNPSLKEPVSVDQDICSGNYCFAQNGQRVLYIKNFNPTVHTGDLMVRDFGKDAPEESRKVDEKVAFVFGTTARSDIYLYAKEYSTKDGTYTLCTLKEAETPTVRAEKAFLAPKILTKSEGAYIYSDYQNGFQTVSYLDLATGSGNVLAEEVTRIERLRMDEKAIIYSKSYEETDKSDYYMVAATENASQKVANAVVNVKESANTRVQFDISDDFSRAAYISGYDEENGRGALMTMSIVNGYVGTEKRISDDAYGCDVSADGAVVRFAANYNRDLGTISLASYTNSNTVTLTEEVGAGAYTFDKAGELMVYARNVQSTPINHGDIECVTTSGRVRKIKEGVSSYGLKRDGQILLLVRDGEGEVPAGKLYFSNEKGSKIKLMDEGVSKALFY